MRRGELLVDIGVVTLGAVLSASVALWSPPEPATGAAEDVPAAAQTATPSDGSHRCVCRGEIANTIAAARAECQLELYSLGVAEPILWPSERDQLDATMAAGAWLDDVIASCPELAGHPHALRCDERPCIAIIGDVQHYPSCIPYRYTQWHGERLVVGLTPPDWPPKDLEEVWHRRFEARARALASEPITR